MSKNYLELFLKDAKINKGDFAELIGVHINTVTKLCRQEDDRFLTQNHIKKIQLRFPKMDLKKYFEVHSYIIKNDKK